jgi:hypothetical protein
MNPEGEGLDRFSRGADDKAENGEGIFNESN